MHTYPHIMINAIISLTTISGVHELKRMHSSTSS